MGEHLYLSGYLITNQPLSNESSFISNITDISVVYLNFGSRNISVCASFNYKYY